MFQLIIRYSQAGMRAITVTGKEWNWTQLRLRLSFLRSVSDQSHLETLHPTCPCRYQNRHGSFQLPILWLSGTKGQRSTSQWHQPATLSCWSNQSQNLWHSRELSGILTPCSLPVLIAVFFPSRFLHPSLPSSFFCLTSTLYLQCIAIFCSFPPSRIFLSITSLSILLIPS